MNKMILFNELFTKDSLETVLTFFSVLIAIYASLIAKNSLKEQRKISKIQGNIEMLNDSFSMLKEEPELIKLHNIKKKDLESSNVTLSEFIYIMSSFNAAYYFYLVEDKKNIDIDSFSTYRRNFLNNSKVFLTWTNIIRPKMSNEGNFVNSIDRYYLKYPINVEYKKGEFRRPEENR
jgi:hypothetical protein